MYDESMQSQLGFMNHQGGAHTSRTVMVNELTLLFDTVPADASWKAHQQAICEQNCLAKQSGRTRKLTARHLTELYALSPTNLIYAGLRFFWRRDSASRAQLALLAATARDPLLREITPRVLDFEPGSRVSREQVEGLIDQCWPGRFSSATLKSTAQNINSSLTKAGYLSGRAKKIRCQFQPEVASVAYALYLGWLRGERGEMLLRNVFARLLDVPQERILDIAAQASARGWMVVRRIDNVIDIDFPELAPVANAVTNKHETGSTAV